MKKSLSLVVIILVALLAFATCPDKQAHQDAVMEEVNGAIDTTIKDKTGLGNSGFGNALSKIGTSLASKVLGTAFDYTLTVDNYYLFSVGKIGVDDNPKTVSIGVFGHVFTTFDPKDL